MSDCFIATRKLSGSWKCPWNQPFSTLDCNYAVPLWVPYYVLRNDGKSIQPHFDGLWSLWEASYPGGTFLSGAMRPEHCWRTFVYPVFSSHSTMTVSSANLLEIKCWKMLKLLCAVGIYLKKKNICSFVESKENHLWPLSCYLETDYPRGKLKRKTMSPLQESPWMQSTHRSGWRGSRPSSRAGLVHCH